MIRKIKQLVLASYTSGQIDVEKINRIVNFLNRQELKQYIKGLKYTEQKSTVIVDVPIPKEQEYKSEFQSIFPDKKIVMHLDPTLILGMRVTDNDIVYEMNLKDRLVSLEASIEEDYD